MDDIKLDSDIETQWKELSKCLHEIKDTEERIAILIKRIEVVNLQRSDWMAQNPRKAGSYVLFGSKLLHEISNQIEILKKQGDIKKAEEAKQRLHDILTPQEPDIIFLNEKDRVFLKERGGIEKLDAIWKNVSQGTITISDTAIKVSLLRQLNELWYYPNIQLQEAKNTAKRIDLLRNLISESQKVIECEPENHLQKLFILGAKSGVKYYEGVLNSERKKIISSSLTCPYPHDSEQMASYKRVAKVFEKQSFWSGSLTDFVFAMNELAVKGFLKANDLDEALSETFAHKPKGKKEVQKLTAKIINNRRRNMKGGRYTESEEIHTTVVTMLKQIKPKE